VFKVNWKNGTGYMDTKDDDKAELQSLRRPLVPLLPSCHMEVHSLRFWWLVVFPWSNWWSSYAVDLFYLFVLKSSTTQLF
jgi:hypothetical protein